MHARAHGLVNKYSIAYITYFFWQQHFGTYIPQPGELHLVHFRDGGTLLFCLAINCYHARMRIAWRVHARQRSCVCA